MKKSILLLILIGFNVYSSEYVIEINKANYGNSVLVEDYVAPNLPVSLMCDLPEVLNESKDSCINPIEEVNWIDTNHDTCSGMRQSNFDPNVYFAMSKSSVVSIDLIIPVGYHWVTKSEYINLFNASTVNTKNNNIYVYHSQCGISGYPEIYAGQSRYVFLLSEGGVSGMHAGRYEYHGAIHNTDPANNSNFAGYVLYKD